MLTIAGYIDSSDQKNEVHFGGFIGPRLLFLSFWVPRVADNSPANQKALGRLLARGEIQTEAF